jgi:hypothetical protein
VQLVERQVRQQEPVRLEPRAPEQPVVPLEQVRALLGLKQEQPPARQRELRRGRRVLTILELRALPWGVLSRYLRCGSKELNQEGQMIRTLRGRIVHDPPAGNEPVWN